jgi:hypothetical protein
MKCGLWAVLLAAAFLFACGGGDDPGPKCEPVEGHCNGLDDDCDGEIDEADEIAADLASLRTAGPFQDARADCAHPTMKGVCGEGVASCIEATLRCETLGIPADADDSACNGFDDDCDGRVDEDVNFDDRDNCGGCGHDAAGQPTIHYCRRESTGTALEDCVNRVCVEANCGNGQDDDGDSYVDCKDQDCDGQMCGGAGFRCQWTAPGDGACLCGTEEICDNGKDDDCDNRVDCADSACLGQACKESNPGLNCGWPSGSPSNSCVERESDCGNGVDDDGDLQKDCLDPDCNGLPCGEGLNCGDAGGAPGCVAMETDCANGIDDDGDGTVDCLDDNCIGLACSTTDAGKNCGFEGANPGCVGRESHCGDGVDDDGDGVADCADPDCADASCGDGCLCTGGIRVEADCTDLAFDLSPIDNDGDGAGNCADLDDCMGESCGPGCLCVPDGESGRAKELRCGDILDNDGDNLQDCQDPDCAGQDCSVTGGPGCTCNPCPDGVCPDGELHCEDGIDNDGDRLADCADDDCAGQRCLGNDGCVCAGGRATEAPDACGDGLDNDGDGEESIDCADSDCADRSCGDGCLCQGGAATEMTANCGDGLDNDRDGAIDCADPDCDLASCGDGCLCENLVPTEMAAFCADGIDNDGNGGIDCADLDCTGDSCGTGCLCVEEAGVGRAKEVVCGDAVDNDGDEAVDCADADCNGVGCGTGVGPVEVDDCRCEGIVPTEIDCGNGADDDLDTLVDCLDPDCRDVAPCPLITAVVPAKGPNQSCAQGHPNQTIVVHGRHFGLDGTGGPAPVTVLLDATGCQNPQVVHLADHDEITCQTATHAPGTVSVTVRNGTSFEDTLADAFTYTSTARDGGTFLAINGACEMLTEGLTATAGGPIAGARARVEYVNRNDDEDTDGDTPSSVIVGEVGFGPAASDSACDPGWLWAATVPDLSVEPHDWDYHVPAATLVAPATPGTYALTFRFSLDGLDWLHCPAVELTVQ